MAHADGDTKAVVFESTVVPVGDSVSQRAVETVATFYGVESTDIGALYSVIDPDAFGSMFAPTRANRDDLE